jgi:hypothetical protein
MIEVRIGHSAQAFIDAEIERARREIERGIETGGWLWSRQGVGWWGGLEVVEASGPGPDDIRGWHEMTLQRGYMHDLDELYRRDGLELCGGWHVQPSGDTTPSSVDEDRIATVLALRADWGCRSVRALELVYAPNYPNGGRGFDVEPWVFYSGTSITGRAMPKPEPTVLVGKDY